MDVISQGATLNFAFDGDSDTAVNRYRAISCAAATITWNCSTVMH
ncbi:hypothetical protein ACLB1E_29620 [Escherichia coli]